MMDAFGSAHVSENPTAIDAFSAAVQAIASHKPNAMEFLKAAGQAEPSMTAAHALAGLAYVILAREDYRSEARNALVASKIAFDSNGGGTAFERAMVAALGHGVEGRLRSAGDSLDDFLYNEPNTLIAAKLSHAFRFMIGDSDGMVSLTARLSASCDPSTAGYGYLLGCHAFGLEEVGRFQEADRVGRRALELCPDDAWAMHAVSHVHEMRGETAEGISWLEMHRPIWSRCSNFSRHVAWHLALFTLEAGDQEATLSVYDRDIADELSGDFRDFANAASILWRLEQSGFDAGKRRWDALAAIADGNAKDATLIFAQLHFLIALIAAKRFDEASDVVELIHHIGGGNSDQARVSRNVGYELASALLQAGQGEQVPFRAGLLARRLHRIGGSHAQRDVFLRSLAMMAFEADDEAGLRQVLAVRRRNKADDSFVANLLAQTVRSPPGLAMRTH